MFTGDTKLSPLIRHEVVPDVVWAKSAYENLGWWTVGYMERPTLSDACGWKLGGVGRSVGSVGALVNDVYYNKLFLFHNVICFVVRCVFCLLLSSLLLKSRICLLWLLNIGLSSLFELQSSSHEYFMVYMYKNSLTLFV